MLNNTSVLLGGRHSYFDAYIFLFSKFLQSSRDKTGFLLTVLISSFYLCIKGMYNKIHICVICIRWLCVCERAEVMISCWSSSSSISYFFQIIFGCHINLISFCNSYKDLYNPSTFYVLEIWISRCTISFLI